MARQVNYDAKIEKLEAQIETASDRLESMQAPLSDLKQKKEERDYRELLDFMKENDISAGEAVEALKASEMYRAKQAEAEQGDQQ